MRIKRNLIVRGVEVMVVTVLATLGSGAYYALNNNTRDYTTISDTADLRTETHNLPTEMEKEENNYTSRQRAYPDPRGGG